MGYSPVLIFFLVCDMLTLLSVLLRDRVYVQIMYIYSEKKTSVGHENIGPVHILGMLRIKLQFNSNEKAKKERKIRKKSYHSVQKHLTVKALL